MSYTLYIFQKIQNFESRLLPNVTKWVAVFYCDKMWKYEISQHSDDDENDWYYRYSEEWKEISGINNKVTTLFLVISKVLHTLFL